jgi:ABC-type branched-subunit amino acid transport system substrate-binding protein
MPDTYREFYGYVSKQLNKTNPTVASFSSDTTSGHNSTKFSSFQLKGSGFNVVYAKGSVPPPPVTDYTPYVQQLMTADNGKAPDAMVCLLAVDCIPIWKGVQAAGYKGYYYSNLYSDALLAAMKGTYANVTFAPFDTPTDGLTEMKKYMAEIKPDYAPDTGAFSAWASTDMFVQALKAAAKSGGISPENVHDKALNQTWQIKGFAGPTRYPDSQKVSTPGCGALTYDDGTAWKTLVPFSCSEKTWPIS